MFGDDRHDGPELHVPAEALRKPKGAEVGLDGQVTCVACGQRFPLSAVDIVGQGYRCAPCTHQAQIASLERGGANVDAGAHLSRGTREELVRQGAVMIWSGGGVLALGVVIIIATIATDAGIKLGSVIAAAGAALMITGSMRKSAGGG